MTVEWNRWSDLDDLAVSVNWTVLLLMSDPLRLFTRSSPSPRLEALLSSSLLFEEGLEMKECRRTDAYVGEQLLMCSPSWSGRHTLPTVYYDMDIALKRERDRLNATLFYLSFFL